MICRHLLGLSGKCLDLFVDELLWPKIEKTSV